MDRQVSKNQEIPVLYESENIVVFDKPAGLLVIQSPRKESKTLLSLVNAELTRGEQTVRLYPCHRLDRDTSGAIMFAKGKRYQKIMMEMFLSFLTGLLTVALHSRLRVILLTVF